MNLVREAFAAAAPARAAGPKTTKLIQDIRGLMKRHGITPMYEDVADNLSRLEFKGTFDKSAKAKDPKRFGGIGGKAVWIRITVSPGRQVWVNMQIWKGKAELSLALPKRDLATTFQVIEKAVDRLLRDTLR